MVIWGMGYYSILCVSTVPVIYLLSVLQFLSLLSLFAITVTVIIMNIL